MHLQDSRRWPIFQMAYQNCSINNLSSAFKIRTIHFLFNLIAKSITAARSLFVSPSPYSFIKCCLNDLQYNNSYSNDKYLLFTSRFNFTTQENLKYNLHEIQNFINIFICLVNNRYKQWIQMFILFHIAQQDWLKFLLVLGPVYQITDYR